MIITDDGSSDNTIEILKKYQKEDKRIKLYQNEKNLGFVKNFEKAISLCSGEYIALADQDDIWKEDKLEVFLSAIQENVLIYSDAILIDKYSNETGRTLVSSEKKKLVSGECNKAFLLTNCVSGNTLMFKRELLEYILPIPEKISFHDVWIAFVASTYGTITYTDEPMTYYRRYSEQVTKKREKDYKSFFDRLKTKEDIRIKDAKVSVCDLELFLSLDILEDQETIKIIKVLKKHYENYQNSYFNYELYKMLDKYSDEIFAIYKENKRAKRVRRTSVGLKLHKATAFIL